MTFIKIKFPDGSFGIQTQEPLSEDQVESLLGWLNTGKSRCARCKVKLTPKTENEIRIKNKENDIWQGLVLCDTCQTYSINALNSVMTFISK